jgi:hypothetical protein
VRFSVAGTAGALSPEQNDVATMGGLASRVAHGHNQAVSDEGVWVYVPYDRGEDARVRAKIDPVLDEITQRLNESGLNTSAWGTHETYQKQPSRMMTMKRLLVTKTERVDDLPDGTPVVRTLDPDRLEAQIKSALEGLEVPPGSHLYVPGTAETFSRRVELRKRARLP